LTGSDRLLRAAVFPAVSGAAVAKHVSNIFSKLGFEPGDENRRVRAILAFLNRSTP